MIRYSLTGKGRRSKCITVVTTLPGYNLIRKVMCEAAKCRTACRQEYLPGQTMLCGVLPRRLSFTRTCTHIMESWLMWSLCGCGKKCRGKCSKRRSEKRNLRQEVRREEQNHVKSTCTTPFVEYLAGRACPVRFDQPPEASVAWGLSNHHCEAYTASLNAKY